jgi:succinate dehydrogenase/fumarate reductase flavoprotein subunit
VAADRVVDVLVLGAGAAGLAAAVTARSHGADTLVLEASSAERHTPNVRMSGGWVMTLDDVPQRAEYLLACAGGLVDRARIEEWARLSTTLRSWLEELEVELIDSGGARAPEHPSLPGAQHVRIARASTLLPSPVPGQSGWWEGREGELAVGGEALYRGLMQAASASGVEIAWNVCATELAKSMDGTVAGVRIGDGVIRARRGVVIATGGFGASPELVSHYFAVPDTRFYGNPRNDGGGLRLAASAGAQLARMNRFAGRGIASFRSPGGTMLGFMVNMAGGGYIICDRQGHRYMDEFQQAALFHDVCYEMQHYDAVQMCHDRSPSYYIFDQRRMDAGPITFPDRGMCGVGLYTWSQDNSKELGRGWIGQGASPIEAAVAVGAPPDAAFDDAVRDYNSGCDTGRDQVGRRTASLTPLDTPPYYCIALHVGGPHTTGGPERDADGRILGALDSSPIPGLYGAGELGQAIGVLYPAAGSSLSEAMTSGLRAGETIVGD